MSILEISSLVSSFIPFTTVYSTNTSSVAGIGMIISAQWELILGNSFGYTVLSAFGKGSDKSNLEPELSDKSRFLLWRLRCNPHTSIWFLGFIWDGYSRIQQRTRVLRPHVGSSQSFLSLWIITNVSLTFPMVFQPNDQLTTSSNLVYIRIFFTVELALRLLEHPILLLQTAKQLRQLHLGRLEGCLHFCLDYWDITQWLI